MRLPGSRVTKGVMTVEWLSVIQGDLILSQQGDCTCSSVYQQLYDVSVSGCIFPIVLPQIHNVRIIIFYSLKVYIQLKLHMLCLLTLFVSPLIQYSKKDSLNFSQVLWCCGLKSHITITDVIKENSRLIYVLDFLLGLMFIF